MRQCVKKISKIIVMFLTILVALTILIVMYLVNQYTRRPQYPAERLLLHDRNREILLNHYHALPFNFFSEDGIELSGYYVKRDCAQRNVLVCHGYRMCKERMLPFVHMFSQDNIIMFDYRAHGCSKGNRTTIGFTECLDVRAALSWIQQQNDICRLPIIGIGISMGAVSLLGAAARYKGFNAIVLDSPFAHLQAQAKKAFKNKYKISGFLLEKVAISFFNYLLSCSLDQINAINWAQQVNIPTLLIHSHDDQTVAFEEAQKVFSCLFSSHKEFWSVSGFGHAKIFEENTENYGKRVEEFLKKILIS